MALGFLHILLIVLAFLSIIAQVFLYKDRSGGSNFIFIINVLLAILFSYLLYTSVPVNFQNQRLFSLMWGIVGIGALVIKVISKKNTLISKLLLSLAVIGGFIHLLI